MTRLIGWLLGIDNVQSISQVKPEFASAWAANAPAWVLFGCVALCALAVWFYWRHQPETEGKPRIYLTVLRCLTLCLLFVIAADPVLTVKLTSSPKPLLYLLFDVTDSMGIQDEMSEENKSSLARAVGMKVPPTASKEKLPRLDYVKSLVKKSDENPFQQLEAKFRLRAFALNRADGVQQLKLNETGGPGLDRNVLAEQLQLKGDVTALGSGLLDLARRPRGGHLSGVVIVSDFGQNSGPLPIGAKDSPAALLGVPIHTVGVGPAVSIDVSVALKMRQLMKKDEKDTVTVLVKQMQLEGRKATVRLKVRPLGADGVPDALRTRTVGEKVVELNGPTTPVEFPFTPDDTSRLQFEADVEPFDEESLKDNNRAFQEVVVRDEFMRLLFVANEPSWEWRFIKEVFQRDKLVGMKGFRTFLRSADPKVRTTNELFLPSLTQDRRAFFSNDVIFLADMPSDALVPRFCEMTKEFVEKFGGGLVVIAGPQFGPSHLADTALADMLPVVVNSDSRRRESAEFALQLAPAARQVGFMQLGVGEEEDAKAWRNVSRLTWYQPVAKLHPLATMLAAHPTDKTNDNKTPQPLIAVRKYGKGEVVYLGFDETWRLRRKYGEQYYRQFWGQMIYRLGLRHALGAEKRFVVRTDRPRYQSDDIVTLTVEAFDEDFKAITDAKLVGRKLAGELILPAKDDAQPKRQPINIPYLQDGVFEARLPVLEGGEHRIRVRDPITGQFTETVFQVTTVSAERQSAVRNFALQREFASATGGQVHDLESFAKLATQLEAPQISETSVQVLALINTWTCFALVVGLMLMEWFTRKWYSLH